MYRNLVPGDVKGDFFSCPVNGHRNLGAGRTFHQPHHRVLRGFLSGNVTTVHPDDAVALLKPRLFRRSSRNHTQHYGRIVGYIELNTYALEIAGEFSLGSLQLHRRQIHGMGIQLAQGGCDGSIRECLDIHCVHIVFLNLLKYEVELAPTVVIPIESLLTVYESEDYECCQNPDDSAEHG